MKREKLRALRKEEIKGERRKKGVLGWYVKLEGDWRRRVQERKVREGGKVQGKRWKKMRSG